MKLWISTALLIACAAAAFAQSPYAGMQTRPVKALSEEQLADLRAGRGMGLALAAELNGYPGPSHALELADKLDLSAAQRAKVQQLFEAMKAEAVPMGARLIEQETELDQLFANRTITAERLKAMTSSIAETRGALRDTHLKYHLSTAAILSPHQMQPYAELRGYGGSNADNQHQHRSHH